MTFHLRSVAVATLVAWWSVLPASAEIEKFMRPCEQKLCPFFGRRWPYRKAGRKIKQQPRD